jgi:hypothetical protein
VQAVIQEDADAVGLSLLSGAHLTLVPRASRSRAGAMSWFWWEGSSPPRTSPS